MRLVEVAQTQRSLILLVLAFLVVLGALCFLPGGLWPAVRVLSLAAIAVYIAIAIMTARLAIVSGERAEGAIVSILLFLIIPIAGVILVIRAILTASEVLRDNGAKVGFFGVSPSELSRLRQYGCTGCGYDVRGLQGGVCPECGANIAATSSADPPETTPNW